jgi:CRISPR-associated protein Cmr2
MPEYTAISFAPVQGFIEKSRKLRDLYGSSGILSYLSHQLIRKAVEKLGEESVISPGLINVQKGMPNRILLHGEFSRDEAKKTVLEAWQIVLNVCREWIEKKVPAKDNYCWEQEWIRWELYSWEIFWGHGEDPAAAMKDLETRKLRRDWTAINWMGESSSLTGTDAIAWHQLGKPITKEDRPGQALTKDEKAELDNFYERLSSVLEHPSPDGQLQGTFLDPNERLSIPELVKRLVTRKEDIAERIKEKVGIPKSEKSFPLGLDQRFSEINRKPENEPGQWTGWFMGDGDEIGKKIKEIYQKTKEQKGEKAANEALKYFTYTMRNWGKNFYAEFPNKNLGQVIYAGGDDFLGVIYSKEPKKPIPPLQAIDWLIALPKQWKSLHDDLQNHLNIENHLDIDMTFSVGFIWAAPSVPQRDILQHCREAEKWAKSLGRDRVTIRVVFNSGQYVQWTCPWDYLHVLKNYRDREGKTWGQNPHWSHVYTDWAQLKSRHAVSFKDKENIDHYIALRLFDLYFSDQSPQIVGLKPVNQDYFTNSDNCKHITGKEYSSAAFIEWIDGLVKVGWQLCSNF